MESKLFIVIAVVMMSLSSMEARRFFVGENDGWVVSPHESYNHWAERHRFQINDTLVFKYSFPDSVLHVTEDEFNHCSTTGAIQSFSDGFSEFKFNRSGPFYFITGNAEHCGRGQKLLVVVMAPRPKPTPAATTPAPVATVPAPVAVSPAPETVSPSADIVQSRSPSPAPAESSAPGFGYSVPLIGGLTGGVATMVLVGLFGFNLI